MSYRINFKIFENTDKFRPAAIFFEKNGYYTSAPQGTTAYREYWDEERDRCLYGYIAEDGESVTGFNYFYLNYCQILLVSEIEVKNNKGNVVKKKSKVRAFPQFYDFDKHFFDVVEEAQETGHHLAVLKARRKGYSYKVAAMLCRNYFLIPNSKGFALASESEYLVRDGILSKAWEIMSFIDAHTAWAKKRQKIDTKIHKRASLVIDKGDGVKTEIGYMSDIIGVSLNGDVDKARGKSGQLIIFEEAGKFKDLKTAWQIARPSVEQGSDVHGLMIAFGTGGTEDVDFDGLKALFYEPEGYNCLPIENVWSETDFKKPCGFFVPYTANLQGEDENDVSFMDKDGNSLISQCKEFVLSQRRKIIENTTDRTQIDRYVAEHCLTPEEATLNISTNIFPKEEMLRHLANLRNSEKLRENKQVGDLIYDSSGKVVWLPTNKPKDLTTYRLDKNADKVGQIVIWEHPINNPPYGLYIAGIDPYDHDKSTTDSLLSCFIYKRVSGISPNSRIIVAEYTGRPEFAEEAYENCRKLLLYYSATALYENQCKGLFSYFAQKHSEYLLADQPEILRDIIKNSNVDRKKGTHMSKEIAIYGEGRIKEWLNEEISPGVKRLTTIMSEPLIEELIAYNDTGNFDRVIAFMLVLLYEEELFRIIIKHRKKENSDRLLFKEPIFQQIIFNF